MLSQCLKIAQKVAFNITSEVSYVYILSGSWLKMPKMVHLDEFWKLEACSQTVLPDVDRSLLIWQKLAESAKLKN